MSARPAAACLLLLICAAPDVSAQQADTNSYRRLVDDYRRFGASAVPRASALTDDEIAAGRHEIAGSWEEQRAAAMLHTEAMLSLANQEQLSTASRHLDVAASLLDDVVKASPSQKDFAYRWYTLTERLLRQFRASATANGLARKARDRFSEQFFKTRNKFDDAVVFELQGCLRGSVPSAQRLGTAGGTELPSRWWMPAARLFGEVLDADPSFLAASLHLGRLNMLEGRIDQAAPYFERALASVDPRVQYLARLFLGSLDERAGRADQAEKRYREAMAGYPWGQAAQLALAQVLSRTGRDAEARALLLDRFGRAGERVIEPLWTYVVQPGDELAALFDELRAEVWR